MKNRYSFSSVGPEFDLKRELLRRFPFIGHSDADSLPFDVMAEQLLANTELLHHQIRQSLRKVATKSSLHFEQELRSLDRALNLSRLGPQHFVSHPESEVLNLAEMCGQLLIWQVLFAQSKAKQHKNVRFLNNVFKALDSMSQEDVQKLSDSHDLPFRALLLSLLAAVKSCQYRRSNPGTNLISANLHVDPADVPLTELNVLAGWVLLAHPSVRTLAYLTSFIETGYLPAAIVWMGWSPTGADGAFHPRLDKNLTDDWQKYGYRQFFSLFEGFDFRCLPVCQHHVGSADINSTELRQLVGAMEPDVLVFSGGGIIKPDTLNTTSGRWLHCHPGDLPSYRGSTCFYYSYLNECRLDCSAFWMSEKLDDGNIIEKTAFDINYPLQDAERYFIDYVLDPQMRRLTLSEVLQNGTESTLLKDNLTSGEQSVNDWPYYVIHPYLRGVCANRIQHAFNAEIPPGIYKTTPL